MKTFTANNRPRCTAFVHRFMGDISLCGKFADWLVTGTRLVNYKYGAKTLCRDCVAKDLINLGDAIDGVSFDIITIVK